MTHRTVRQYINGQAVGVDERIAPIVCALNNAGLRTVASCCGHGQQPGNIALADGREIIIADSWETARKIHALFPPIHDEYRAEWEADNEPV